MIILDEQGSVVVAAPLKRAGDLLPTIIEEDLQGQVVDALGFAETMLEKIDPTHRLAQVTPVVALIGGSHMSWQTRAQHAASPNRATISLGSETGVVSLTPPNRARAALRLNRAEIAEDLVVLLRRSRR